MIVRLTTDADRDEVLNCVRDAFSGEDRGGRDEVDVVVAVWALDAPVVGGDLVAVAGGVVVGHVLASPGRLGDRAVPGIAPLAVRPGHQGHGIGTALVRDVLRGLDRVGFPLVVVLGDPGYYRRFGFEPSGPRGIHYGPVGSDDPHFQIRRLSHYDTACTGEYTYSWEVAPGR